MHSFRFVLVLFLPLFAVATYNEQGVTSRSSDAPIITIINTSNQNYAYDVEKDSAAPASAFSSCTACVKAPAGQTVRFYPGHGFNGALTARHHHGTRHELNFLSTPGQTWYDSDMQLGMSDETLGPSDHRKQLSGKPSLAGEPDTVAKANAAWKETSPATQHRLLSTGYVRGTVGGALTHLTMDAHAPYSLVSWLQLKAHFNAYIGSGSVAGRQTSIVNAAADLKTMIVSTNKMTITIH